MNEFNFLQRIPVLSRISDKDGALNKLKIAACFAGQLPKIVIIACNETNMNSSDTGSITGGLVE